MVSGPLHIDGEERLESIGEGTGYHTRKKGETDGLFKLADPIVEAREAGAGGRPAHPEGAAEAKVPAGA